MSSDDRKTDTVTAFLSVYSLTRHYGGPEEGGWWYDVWEHTGASFPFLATQEFYATEATDKEQNDGLHHCWCSEDNKLMKWEPDGNPVPLDPVQFSLVKAAEDQFIKIYGDPEAKQGRYSVLGGTDVKFMFELIPGEHTTTERPRYE